MSKKIIGLGVEIDDKKGFIQCNTETWMLKLQYYDSDTPILETSMDNIKNIYKKESLSDGNIVYSYIQIDTVDGQEIIVRCEEKAVLNNPWVFCQGINRAFLDKYDPDNKKKRKALSILGQILVIIAIVAVLAWIIDKLVVKLVV